MTEESIKELALHFESTKIGMYQNAKDGYILKLSIHPNDVPGDLFKFMVGQRFMVGLVPMNDQDEPTETPEHREARKAVSIAGMLCRDESFQRWLVDIGMANFPAESAAADALKEHLGLESRSELRENERARAVFHDLVEEFKNRNLS